MPQVAIALAITAGGMALQYLLRPKTKQEPVDKGKMDDIRVQGSDYGAIIPNVWGLTRQAGNVIFSSGIDHYTVTTGGNSGGKKNPGTPQTINHIYKTSVGVLVSQGELESFKRIWADSDIIIDNTPVSTGRFEAEDATLTGGATTFSDPFASGGDAVENLGNGGKATFDISSVSPPAEPPHDPEEEATEYTRLSFYYSCPGDSTRDVTIDTDTISPISASLAGFDDMWSPYTVHVEGHADTVTWENASDVAPDLDLLTVEKYWVVTYNPTLNRSFQITGIVNPDIEYPPDLNDPSEYYNYPASETKDGGTGTYSISTSVPGELVRFYTGTETQTADSKIISWLDSRYGSGQGVLRASAHRGLAYVIFQDRTLKSSRIENFTFETDTGDATVNTILEDLFAECGLSASDYTITATAGLEQIGFIDNQKQSRKSLIESLARYHFFRTAEIDGKIKTILDTFTSAGTIDDDDMRAHGDNEEMPRYDCEVVPKEEHLLPREVRVSVMQPELDYHNESVPAMLFADISGKESKEYTFPIVDPASAARTVAEKLLLKEYSEAQAFEFWGMPVTAQYAIGEVITLPVNGVNYNVRIEKKQMTLPIGKVRFQCVSVNPFTPTYYQDEVTTTNPISNFQAARDSWPRNSIVFPIQSVPIRDADSDRLGVYLALCGRGRGQGDGISLYREMDEDNFVVQRISDGASPVGLCEDTLATHGDITTEDTVNTLDIWFFDDVDLESVTQSDIERHPLINLIRIGDEWVQFRTATVQTLEDNSPYRSKWRISNLWRGRFETSAAKGSHVADEYAALVDGNMFFYDLEPADIGMAVNLKAVTSGQSVEIAPVTSFVFDPISDETDERTLFDHYADATTTGTSEEVLWIDQIAAGTMRVNGDKIEVKYWGVTSLDGGAKIWRINFGGEQIFASDDTDTIFYPSARWEVHVSLMRVSNTTLRSFVELEMADPDRIGMPFTSYLETSLPFDFDADDYDLELKAETSGMAGEITAKFGYGIFTPAAVTETDYLLDEDDVLLTDEDEEELSDG